MKKLGDGNLERFKPQRGMHSELHALTKDLSELCGEPKRFGMYLGRLKAIGVQRGYQIYSELKQSKAKNLAALFMYKTKRPRPKMGN